VRVLQLAQLRPLQQFLVLLDRTADLAFLAIEVAQDEMDLERISGRAGRLGQLFDRLIDLVGDEEVEAQHVVRRLARAATIDPHAVLELVALPRLAGREADQEEHEHEEQRGGGGHQDGKNSETAAAQAPWALRTCRCTRARRPGRRRWR
jgi:hypothetical protein